MTDPYLHGFSSEEQTRLGEQNRVLAPFIYDQIDLRGQRSLVEFGTGTGAQLVWLLKQYPQIRVTGIDHSPEQLQAAERNLQNAEPNRSRWELLQGDVCRSGLATHTTFDAGLIVWVLEHLPLECGALAEMRRLLQPGSPVYITEVLNQSLYLSPCGDAVSRYWSRMNEFQESIGGSPNVGAHLGWILEHSGFEQIDVRPVCLHFDCRDPGRRRMMLEYWLDLMQSSLQAMLQAGFVSESDWQLVQAEWRELLSTDDAVFFYSFVQAFARAPQ